MHYKRRAYYEEFSGVYGKICVRLGLTPNLLTGISLGFSVLSGAFFWQNLYLAGVLFMVLNALTDMLDGATARASNTGTRFGGVLDHVSDRWAEFFVLCGILLSGQVSAVAVLFAQFGILIASYTRAAAESIGQMSTCAVGLAGRLEKFIILIIGGLGQWLFPQVRPMEYALVLTGGVSIITAIQRLWFAKKELKDKARGS